MTATRLETKRPNEVRDYSHDWSAFLGEDTIVTSDVTVDGVTLDSDTNTDTTVTFWLSGGTADTLATITNTITTAGGRTETEVFTLRIAEYSEPVSLDQAKAQLRVTDDSEDALICGFIRAAREYVENYTGRVLVRRAFTETFDSFGNYLELLRRPFVSVDEVAYTDTDGAAQTVASYAVMSGAWPLRVYPAYGESWPAIRSNTEITATYTAGYGLGEEPQALVQAILLLVSTWFANREAVSDRPANEIPFAVQSLCDQHRVPGL